MSWAGKRRLIILAILGAVLLLIMGGIAFLIFNKPASCVDGKQNQNEEGIDCGGSCGYLCTAKVVPPVVSFVREFSQANGRTDVIAYLKNPNPSAAAKNVRYTVELYSVSRAVIAKKDGVVDLAPGLEIPVYLPNFYSGTEAVDRAFLSLDASSYGWFRYDAPPQVPVIKDARVSGTTEAPRVLASATNPFATPLRGIKLVATVFNAEGNAIAASQTVVAELAPQASVEVVFTWNAPFTDSVSRIDVRPSVVLPTP
jgi:hypothetical protein